MGILEKKIFVPAFLWLLPQLTLSATILNCNHHYHLLLVLLLCHPIRAALFAFPSFLLSPIPTPITSDPRFDSPPVWGVGLDGDDDVPIG